MATPRTMDGITNGTLDTPRKKLRAGIWWRVTATADSAPIKVATKEETDSDQNSCFGQLATIPGLATTVRTI